MSDPIERFKEVLARAERSGIELPNAVTLATVGEDGMPSARMVLLKDVSDAGFTFYTNLESRKARELAANSNAALCFWWPSIGEQVRVEGTVKPVSDKEADAYFTTRDRGSQVGAWASKQSSVIPSRDALTAEFERMKKQYEGRDVPRPSFWSGFRLTPACIEFWINQANRLHERFLYLRSGDSWEMSILSP